MKVAKIKVQNLKSVSELEVDFKGCTAIITGGNDKGKSSFLKSLPERLQGEKPKEILQRHEEEGFTEWELTDGSKFIWEFTKEKEKLTFITSDGIEIKTGVVKMLGQKFFGEKFDIDKFLHSGPKDQKKILQKLVGIDLTEIEDEYDKAYDERTEKNAILKTEEAKCEGLEIVEIEGEKIDLKKLYDDLVNVQNINDKIKGAKGFIDGIGELVGDKKKMIENLQKEVVELEDQKVEQEKRLESNKYKDPQPMRDEIEKVEENNRTFESNDQIQKQLDTAKESRKVWKESNERVKEIEQRKFDMIKACKLPELFEFTTNGITYNGYELDKNQLSSSSIYIASLKLASMVMGEIETLCFDASYLDKNSLQKIEDRAKNKGLQLLIERPDYDGGEIKYELLCD